MNKTEFNIEGHTATIKRIFNAPADRVWQCFSEAEHIDQWWAPKPFEAKTKVMNFEVGGRRFYAMVSPEGGENWAIQRYTSIAPKTNIKFLNAFADEYENPQLPGSDWDLTFSEENGKTKVTIVIYNESIERMKMMIEMGFKEGFTATLDFLDELLTQEN